MRAMETRAIESEGHRDKSHRGQDHGDGIARGLEDSVVEKESEKGCNGSRCGCHKRCHVWR